MRCPDCLDVLETSIGGWRGNGVRNPALWTETLAEVQARETRGERFD